MARMRILTYESMVSIEKLDTSIKGKILLDKVRELKDFITNAKNNLKVDINVHVFNHANGDEHRFKIVWIMPEECKESDDDITLQSWRMFSNDCRPLVNELGYSRTYISDIANVENFLSIFK